MVKKHYISEKGLVQTAVMLHTLSTFSPFHCHLSFPRGNHLRNAHAKGQKLLSNNYMDYMLRIVLSGVFDRGFNDSLFSWIYLWYNIKRDDSCIYAGKGGF